MYTGALGGTTIITDTDTIYVLETIEEIEKLVKNVQKGTKHL